ncbi:MAG: 50S ribosomal protein L29 [Candidatus Omnitrophica bacterium]|nr:50S ribosomal protein L29 [Candidatus Omnitrophota bacterium]MCA9407480.1 50S ribosomal protein L29 [Candidatus Omnitrophota bacterium]
MKVKELRDLSSEDLAKKEKVFKKDLFDLHYQRQMGAVEKPSRFRQIRRDIARIQTILKERELNNE